MTCSTIMIQVSCTMASLGCMRFVPFVQFNVFPRASPSGIHKTALRVQISYTLASHGTTITCPMENDVCRGELFYHPYIVSYSMSFYISLHLLVHCFDSLRYMNAVTVSSAHLSDECAYCTSISNLQPCLYVSQFWLIILTTTLLLLKVN